MKGYLIDKDGTQYQLPELLSWDVCHGTGEPCDYFEVKTLYTAALLPKLGDAVRFKGTNDGATVFYGVVDEYQVSIDESELRLLPVLLPMYSLPFLSNLGEACTLFRQ